MNLIQEHSKRMTEIEKALSLIQIQKSDSTFSQPLEQKLAKELTKLPSTEEKSTVAIFRP